MATEWDATITTEREEIVTRFYDAKIPGRTTHGLFKIIYAVDKGGKTEVLYDQRGNFQKEYRSVSDLEKDLGK